MLLRSLLDSLAQLLLHYKSAKSSGNWIVFDKEVYKVFHVCSAPRQSCSHQTPSTKEMSILYAIRSTVQLQHSSCLIECTHCKRYVHYLAHSQCLHYFIQCCNKPGSIIASICTMQNNSFLDILAQIFVLHQSCSRPRPLGHYGAVLRRALSLARYCTLIELYVVI